MEMTYEPKTTQAAPEKAPRAAAPTAAGGIPNSAMLSMLGASDDPPKNNTDALEAAIMSRLPQMRGRPQPQIPSAEREADRLSASVTSGSPDAVKAAMGARLEADLSGVRFHTDSASAARADAMGARAFTAGADVYFGGEGFEPSVAAHELVHTVQQGAVAGGMETVSAPLGGVQMWSPFGRKKTPERKTAPTIDFSKPIEELKPENGAIKVGRMATTGQNGEQAVIKMGVDPDMERAMAAYYNTAADIYREMFESDWDFDASNYRPLEQGERPGVQNMLQHGILTRKVKNPDGSQASDDAEMNRVGVFTNAPGEKPQIADSIKDDRRASLGDYRHMMGAITMLDLVSGNTDRLTGMFNPDNWKEEVNDRKVHLLDNDMYGAGRAAGNRLISDADWLENLVTLTSQDKSLEGAQGDTHQAAMNLAYNLTDTRTTRDNPERLKLMGRGDAAGGMEDAVGMLPELRKRLKKQFEKESGGNLTEPQQMLLERLQVSNDYLTKKKHADIYRNLAQKPAGSSVSYGLRPIPNEDGSAEDSATTTYRNQQLARRNHRSPWQWLKDKFSRKKS